MAKETGSDDGFFYLFCALVGIVGLPLFINTYLVRNHFAKKYALGNGEIRVTEGTGNMIKNFALGAVQLGILLILSVFFLFLGINFLVLHEQPLHIVWGMISLIAGIFFILYGFGLSAYLGASQIGMLIFPDRGTFVIPVDTARNTFTENVMHGKLLFDRYNMEELPLEEITKITREGGKKAFIHGKFGTRCVKWRNKQKRDECIAALEMAKGKRLDSLDMGY